MRYRQSPPNIVSTVTLPSSRNSLIRPVTIAGGTRATSSRVTAATGAVPELIGAENRERGADDRKHRGDDGQPDHEWMGARRDNCGDEGDRLEDHGGESGEVALTGGQLEPDRDQDQGEDDSEVVVDPVHAGMIARAEDATSRLSRSGGGDPGACRAWRPRTDWSPVRT